MNLATLQDSVFLHALGSAILNSLWQAFILWIIYEIINLSYKNLSSSFKNKFSTLLLFISFVWFLISFVSELNRDNHNLTIVNDNVSPAIINVGAHPFTFNSVISLAGNTVPYLSIAYMLLLFILFLKLFSSYRYVYVIAKRRLMPPPPGLEIFTDKVVRELNISKKISVWISKKIDVPATIGFFKPVILIPLASVNNLTIPQLEAIILHELSHIKRNDYLVNLFISVIETILFFNPFILLLAKAIKKERENCCDDFVMQYKYDPQSYATALLRLEQSRRGSLQLAIGAVSGKKQLLSRIKRITNDRKTVKQFNYGQKLFALLIVTFIICSIAWLSPVEKNKSLSQTATTKQAASEKNPILPGNRKTEPAAASAKLLESVIETAVKTWSKDDKLVDIEKTEVNKHELIPETINIKSGDDKLLFELQNPQKSFSYTFDTDHPESFFKEDFFKNGALNFLSDFSIENLNLQFDTKFVNKALKDANNMRVINLRKVEEEAAKSLALFKSQKFSQADLDVMQYLPQNFEYFPEIENLKKTTPGLKIFRQLRNSFIVLDSMNRILDDKTTPTSLRKVRTWKRVPPDNRAYTEKTDVYNYTYRSAPVPLPPPPSVVVNETAGNPGDISVARLNRNGLIIEHVEKRSKKPKTSFHFAMSNDSKSSSTEQKMITIEVTEN